MASPEPQESILPGGTNTETDEFIATEASKVLLAGERITHTAYLVTHKKGLLAALSKAYYVLVTDQRLILIKTKVGAFKPILSNEGVEALPRSEVDSIGYSGGGLEIAIAGRKPLKFFARPKNKHVTGQAAFFAEVPATFGGSGPPQGLAKWARVALGIVVAAAVIGYGVYRGMNSTTVPGKRISLGQGKEIYYRSGVNPELARKTGVFLRDNGYLGTGKATLLIGKIPPGYTLGFVIKASLDIDDKIRHGFRTIGNIVSDKVLEGAPVTVELLSDKLKRRALLAPATSP